MIPISSQRELRREFWRQHPYLYRKRIPDYAGTGRMYCTDTRCAFVDWLDAMEKDGQLAEGLVAKATLG